MPMLAASQLKGPDYVILVGYFVLMLGIGGYFYRYMKRMKDYFSGGNRIPWWLSGVSFYMSCFSVYGFVVYSGLAFKYGWMAITMFWTYIPATLLAAFVFGPRWRRARVDSPVEYLESRYGSALRQMFAWQGIPVKLIDDALKIVAIGIFLSASLGLGKAECMLGAGVIMLVYTFMGGLWAVTVTDFVQFIVMIAAIVVLFPLSIIKAGGLKSFITNSPDGFFLPVAGEYGWIYMGSLVFMMALSMSSIHWQLVQRFTCVRDEREGHRIGYLVTGLHLVTPILMYIPAMAARHFLSEDIAQDQVYPTLCITLLPTGLLGLMIAAMFAATMSMLSSDYNVCAGVLTNDIYRRLIRPDASQKELVLVGRLMTLLVGGVGLGIAFIIMRKGGNNDGLFRMMVQLFSVATAPIAIPMLLGLLTKRINNIGATWGFLAGLATGLLVFYKVDNEYIWGPAGLKKENILLLSTAAATGLVTIVISLLTRRKRAEQNRVENFFKTLSTPVGQLAGDPDFEPAAQDEKAISPFRIVGFSIIVIGLMMLAVLPFIEGRTEMGLNGGISIGLILIGGIVLYAARKSDTTEV